MNTDASEKCFEIDIADFLLPSASLARPGAKREGRAGAAVPERGNTLSDKRPISVTS